MDFNIQTSQDGTQSMVRVAEADKTNVSLFCKNYSDLLEKVKKEKRKIKMLFDLRLATTSGVYECKTVLADFFENKIKKLSEETLLSCTVVVRNELIQDVIQGIFNQSPGTVPTTFTSQFPNKRATSAEV
jgi:hypothetical protein